MHAIRVPVRAGRRCQTRMYAASVTFEVTHVEMSPSKAGLTPNLPRYASREQPVGGDQAKHMKLIFVTRLVSQLGRSWLKRKARKNLPSEEDKPALSSQVQAPCGHVGHVCDARGDPCRDVLVEADGLVKPARRRVNTTDWQGNGGISAHGSHVSHP